MRPHQRCLGIRRKKDDLNLRPVSFFEFPTEPSGKRCSPLLRRELPELNNASGRSVINNKKKLQRTIASRNRSLSDLSSFSARETSRLNFGVVAGGYPLFLA